MATNNYPDIVLLILDTHRIDRISCYGYPEQITPNIDAFAQQATRFTQAISPSQWTLPAHASMFTGLYPSEHMMYQLDSMLPQNIPTVAEQLHSVGYFTAAFSNNPFVGAIKNGLHRGFDQITNYSYMGSGLWTADFDSVATTKHSLKEYRRLARRLLAKSMGYTQHNSTNFMTSIFDFLMKNTLKFKGGSKSYNIQNTLSAASTLLTRRNSSFIDRPVFTFINLMGTHSPYDAPDWAIEKYVIPVVGHQSTRQLINHANKISLNIENWAQLSSSFLYDYQQLVSAMYNAEVAAQDALLGNFFHSLKTASQFDDTVVIITADHGEHLGDKLRMNHLVGAYNGLVHVPLLIHALGGNLPLAETIETPVSLRSIYHTILNCATIDTETNQPSLLMKPTLSSDEPVYVEAVTPQWILNRLQDMQLPTCPTISRAIYQQGYKLIQTDDISPELYAWPSDQTESNNLATTHFNILETLQMNLNTFIDRIKTTTQKQYQLHSDDPEIVARLRNLGYLE